MAELVAKLVVTGLLLGYAVVTADPSVGNVVVGASVGYWLREGEHQALRRVARDAP